MSRGNPLSKLIWKESGGDIIRETGITKVNSLQLLGGDSTQGIFSWNTDEETADLTLNGSILQLGQELHGHVRNASGSTIANGTPVMLYGTIGASGRITVIPMVSTNQNNSKYILGITTEDILNGEDGKITALGKVRGINTIGGLSYDGLETWDDGDILYLDPDHDGYLTNVEPATSDKMDVGVAVVIFAHASSGSIYVRITPLDRNLYATINGLESLSNKTIDASLNTLSNINVDSFQNDLSDTFKLMVGSTLDTISVNVDSSGTNITLSIEKSGGGDIRFYFSDGIYTYDSTPSSTVLLTPGTDQSPVENYIYVLQSNRTLTASTSGFPSEEYSPIARVLCQSAASLQTDGPYKVHVYTDHVAGTNGNGHLHHLNYWIRQVPATWNSGVLLTPSITTNPSSEDNIDISVSAGFVLQLHSHSFPSFNTSTGSELYIVNKSSGSYTKITDLNEAGEDDSGNAITNNKYMSLIIWGCISEKEEDSKLFVNLPSGFYTSEADAIADTLKYDNYNIPSAFIGTGFLISRLTFKYTTASSGTWTLSENLDLRGTFPSVIAGGTSAVSTEFIDSSFKILNNLDVTKILQFQLSGLTTGNTRTLISPDVDGLMAIITNNVPASSSASGKKGEISFDSTYAYICIADNTWIRFAITTSF